MVRFRGRILSFGELPPAGGELRRRYLQREGALSFNAALDLWFKSKNQVVTGFSGGTVELPGSHTQTYSQCVDFAAIRRLHQDYTAVRVQLTDIAVSAPASVRPGLATLWESAESTARKALSTAVDAYNYLEDSAEHESDAHGLVHDIGAYVAGMFGCVISEVDGTYHLTCPVDLMHRRIGFSAGIIHTVKCSICDSDLDECDHMLNTTYPVIVKHRPDGRCTACQENDCSHYDGETIWVAPTEVFRNPQMREVTMTPRPRDPRARLSMIELDRDELASKFHRTLNGEDLECWECLGPCPGFSGMPES